ncbi:Hcp family type VI secretion system effector [Enterobacteriaceae bacterium BIT-l23]|uniref:Hcp family type VI secretion system effector n=1 Tax=Jejubacter sp. L23 TaxID=3092086 RepID=UPI001585AF52|nr:Hcp family type VI secretion system effector [Enterobacteriaceae bacterium BIT-l23]
MPIPAYMWLKDDGGADIKGSVDVQDREGSIEVVGFSHGLNLPVDSNTGKITGTRSHSPVIIEKEFDSSSPYLYKAVAKGQTLKSAEIKWYRINHAGQEEAYFVMLFEGVKITGVNPGMPNAKLSGNSQINHMESVSMMYERVTWRYVDGNVQYTDDWNMRS